MELNSRQEQIVAIVRNGVRVGSGQMLAGLGSVSRATLLRDLGELVNGGVLRTVGVGSGTEYELVPEEERQGVLTELAKKVKVGSKTKWGGLVKAEVDKTGGDDEPLVDIEVKDPITPLRKWLKKLLDNEGFEFSLKFKLRPLTTIAVVMTIMGTGISVGKAWDWMRQMPGVSQVIKSEVRETPVPRAMPVEMVERSLVGVVVGVGQNTNSQMGKSNYYVVSGDEVVKVLGGDMSEYVGKRVMVTGTMRVGGNEMVVVGVVEMEKD